jgi:hypothetical protein
MDRQGSKRALQISETCLLAFALATDASACRNSEPAHHRSANALRRRGHKAPLHIATGRSDRLAIVAPNRNLWSSMRQTRSDRANRVRKLRSCDGIVLHVGPCPMQMGVSCKTGRTGYGQVFGTCCQYQSSSQSAPSHGSCDRPAPSDRMCRKLGRSRQIGEGRVTGSSQPPNHSPLERNQ